MYKGLRGLQKSSEVSHDLWLWSEHSVAMSSITNSGWVGVALVKMGLVKSSKLVGGDVSKRPPGRY